MIKDYIPNQNVALLVKQALRRPRIEIEKEIESIARKIEMLCDGMISSDYVKKIIMHR